MTSHATPHVLHYWSHDFLREWKTHHLLYWHLGKAACFSLQTHVFLVFVPCQSLFSRHCCTEVLTPTDSSHRSRCTDLFFLPILCRNENLTYLIYANWGSALKVTYFKILVIWTMKPNLPPKKSFVVRLGHIFCLINRLLNLGFLYSGFILIM